MSKKQHEINNAFSTLQLSQQILEDYFQGFRLVLKKVESGEDHSKVWEEEDITYKVNELEAIFADINTSMEKIKKVFGIEE